MMNRFMSEWLKEGYSSTTGSKNEVRRKNTLLSTLTIGKGDVRTPKPLFPLLLNEIESEPYFIPKHLLNLENKYLRAATIKFENYFSKIPDEESLKGKIPKGRKIIIEYSRKSIFLSRVMFNLFEMPDSSVPKGSIQYPKVLEKNALYQSALERHQKYPDIFIEQSIQTDFIDAVDKQIETVPMVYEDKNCMINNYLINEHYDQSEMEVKRPPKTFKEYFDDETKFSDYNGFLINLDNYPEMSRRIRDVLYVMEKSLDYNTHKNSILKYNGSNKDLETSILDSATAPGDNFNDASNLQLTEKFYVKHHLRFYFEKLNNHFQVTCLECSPLNLNIFAVGYGVSRFNEMDHEPRGVILCWNLHKSGYPEKMYYTEEIITCMEFSKSDPYLVAVGMRYGLIAIFDLRKSEKLPSISNYESKFKPVSTINNIRWIKKNYAMGKEMEILVSVSMDGLICSWTFGRNLDGHLLRYIKRGGDISNRKRRLIVAVDSAGMCMQFNPEDDEIFMIGTSEGEVLQSSINDLDSYMYEYKCHNGVLYDMQWSPLVSEVFMTTGTDYFIHIWQVGKRKPSKSLTLESIVLQVAWSCVKSTLFAAMSKTKILFFDLSIDLHKQIAEYTAKDIIEFTFIRFCSKNNWFFLGQSNGATELCELVNIPDLINQEEELRKTFLSE